MPYLRMFIQPFVKDCFMEIVKYLRQYIGIVLSIKQVL